MVSSLASILSAFPLMVLDFTVMDDKAVGMRSLPAGICVGRKAGMYDGNCGLIVPVLKVCKKVRSCPTRNIPFIHNSPAGKRRHIGIIVALLELAAHHIKTAVKIQSFLTVPAFYKALTDYRHTFSGLMS